MDEMFEEIGGSKKNKGADDDKKGDADIMRQLISRPNYAEEASRAFNTQGQSSSAGNAGSQANQNKEMLLIDEEDFSDAQEEMDDEDDYY